MPSTMTTAILRRNGSFSRNNATSARMPPSPSLSARMIRTTYLTDTTIAIDQITIEMTPKTSAGVGLTLLWSMLKTICSAYSGLVPISPKTTPRAPSASAKPVSCLAKGTSVMLFCFVGSDGQGCPGDDSGRAGSPESLLMLTQNGDTRMRRGHSRGPAAVRLSRLDDERPVGSDVYGSGALDRDRERRRADSGRLVVPRRGRPSRRCLGPRPRPGRPRRRRHPRGRQPEKSRHQSRPGTRPTCQRRHLRQIPDQQTRPPRLPNRVEERLADRDRHHRRRLQTPRQRPDGTATPTDDVEVRAYGDAIREQRQYWPPLGASSSRGTSVALLTGPIRPS